MTGLLEAVRKPAAPMVAPVGTGVVRRTCSCDHEHGGGAECSECKKKQVQRAAAAHASGGGSRVPPIVGEVLRSPGQSLDRSTRSFMERRIGHDFGSVRIHTDAQAAASARAVHALAYTVGRDVVFDAGRYAPQTLDGRRLIAHELTHVAQQGGGDATGMTLQLGAVDDAHEQHAERVARAAVLDRGPRVAASTAPRPSGVLRRQVNPPAPEVEPNIAVGENVPYEKWSQTIEGQYRARGDNFRANAVRKCRVSGGDACPWLLSVDEVHALLALSKSSGGDPKRVEMGMGAAAPVLARALRAAPTLRLVPPPAPVPPPGVAPGVGVGGAATAAGIGAIVAICVIAGMQLWELGQFEDDLRAKGFIILEAPLALCIGGCHQSAPSPGPNLKPLLPSNDEWIRKWLEDRPMAGKRRLAPIPVPPVPVPAPPAARPKSTRCTDDEVDAMHDAVKEACDKERSCSPQLDTCDTAKQKIAAGYACIDARERLQKKCFQKGDPGYDGHMRQIAEAYAALRNCEAVVQAKC
jgi:hypothetical protein